MAESKRAAAAADATAVQHPDDQHHGLSGRRPRRRGLLAPRLSQRGMGLRKLLRKLLRRLEVKRGAGLCETRSLRIYHT
jgi:hypothetical protein